MRNFIHDPAPQQTDAWRLARVGRLTGSCADAMLATIKKGEAAAKRDLRRRLVAETLTRQPIDSVSMRSRAMQRGVDRQTMATSAYEGRTRQIVRSSGFLAHREVMAGCSLDGHVGDFEGIIEIKCPDSTTHVEYLQTRGALPEDYLPQIMHNLWISGALWCDFVSFDDRFLDPALQLYIVRVPREVIDFAVYEQRALAFLADVDRDVQAIRTSYQLGETLRASLAVAS
jgi:hypothetical protein